VPVLQLRPRQFSLNVRVEDGSAGLNGFPCFVECGDKNANLIRAKCPWVFLEICAFRSVPLRQERDQSLSRRRLTRPSRW
jgi:hypothetical protein